MKRIVVFVFCILGFVEAHTGAAFPVPVLNTSGEGVLGQSINFDGSESLNHRGQKYGVEYRFRVMPGGNWSDWGYNPKFVYRPTKTGNFNAHLEVRDRETQTTQTRTRSFSVRLTSGRSGRIEVSPAASMVGDNITFTMKLFARGGSGVMPEIRWDFDGDGKYDTEFAKTVSATHIYPRTGQFRPNAEIKFRDGEILKVTGMVVQSNSSFGRTSPPKGSVDISAAMPLPRVQVSPRSDVFNIGATVNFTAIHPNAASAIWWIEGKTYKGATASHVFKSVGKKEVLLQTGAQTSRHSITIEDTPTEFQAQINAYSDQGYMGNQGTIHALSGRVVRFSSMIRYNGSNLYPLKYRWDFEGDGIYDTGLVSANYAEHTYFSDKPNTIYRPTVEIVAVTGMKATATMSVFVTKNEVVASEITVRKVRASSVSDFYPNENLYFGTKSDYRWGNQNKYRWDFDGDGEWDTAFMSVHSHTYSYAAPGNYTLKMQTQDKSGKVLNMTKSIEIKESPKLKPVLQVSNRYGTSRTNFTFDATHTQGHQLSALWFLDGKKIGTGLRISRSNLAVGSHEVLCQIFDGSGDMESVRFPIEVKAISQTTSNQNSFFPNWTQRFSNRNLGF